MPSFNLPSKASLVLSVLAGVLAVLNAVVFHVGSDWSAWINAALVFLAGIGISPLVGPAFRAALHLSPVVSLFLSAGISALTVGLSTLHMSSALHAVIAAALAFLAGLGFGPATAEPFVTPAGGSLR